MRVRSSFQPSRKNSYITEFFVWVSVAVRVGEGGGDKTILICYSKVYSWQNKKWAWKQYLSRNDVRSSFVLRKKVISYRNQRIFWYVSELFTAYLHEHTDPGKSRETHELLSAKHFQNIRTPRAARSFHTSSFLRLPDCLSEMNFPKKKSEFDPYSVLNPNHKFINTLVKIIRTNI